MKVVNLVLIINGVDCLILHTIDLIILTMQNYEKKAFEESHHKHFFAYFNRSRRTLGQDKAPTYRKSGLHCSMLGG